jgi:hypothetical protein
VQRHRRTTDGVLHSALLGHRCEFGWIRSISDAYGKVEDLRGGNERIAEGGVDVDLLAGLG